MTSHPEPDVVRDLSQAGLVRHRHSWNHRRINDGVPHHNLKHFS